MRRAAAAVVLAAAFAASACSRAAPPRAELVVVVLPGVEGRQVGEDEVYAAAAVVDLALKDLGLDRREVLPLGGDRLRIVLPESQAGRMAEVRERLADPKLRVRVEEPRAR